MSDSPPIEVDAARGPPLGMPAEAFLHDYWQKRPLLIRAAFPDFVDPLTPEDLAGLACESWALSRLVRFNAKNERWTLRQGPFRESEFPRLPKRDWTLLVQDVDKWDEDVRALLANFSFLPSWRIDDVMISFAATGGSVGAHVDQYDVFLIQGEGARRWQISTDPRAPTEFRDDVELKLLKRFAPTHTWVLRPGDMLYLPAGVPHHGVALQPSLTYSIGMRAPSLAEMAADWVDELAERLGETQRYADPDLRPATRHGEIDAAALQRVRAAMLQTLRQDDAQLQQWFGRMITRYRSAGEVGAPPKPVSAARLQRALAAGARLQPHPLSRMAWTQRDAQSAVLFVNGQSQSCRLPLAQALCAAGKILLPPLQEEDNALILQLVQQGHLLLVR